MIIVLCSDYEESLMTYNTFVRLLERIDPQSITRKSKYALFVEIDDFRYHFIDYHYSGIFNLKEVDYIDADEFFNDVYAEGRSAQNAGNGRSGIL